MIIAELASGVTRTQINSQLWAISTVRTNAAADPWPRHSIGVAQSRERTIRIQHIDRGSKFVDGWCVTHHSRRRTTPILPVLPPPSGHPGDALGTRQFRAIGSPSTLGLPDRPLNCLPYWRFIHPGRATAGCGGVIAPSRLPPPDLILVRSPTRSRAIQSPLQSKDRVPQSGGSPLHPDRRVAPSQLLPLSPR